MNLHLISDINTDTLGLVFSLNGNGWPWEFTFKELEAHIFNKGKKIRTGFSGTGSPYSERDCPKKINPSSVWIDVQEGDSLNIWVKLNMAETTLSRLDIELQANSVLNKPRQLNYSSTGHLILTGTALGLLLISFFLYLWFRDPVYLWFFLIQLSFSITIFLSAFENESYLFLFKENPRSIVYLTTLSAVFRIVAILQFARVYIKTKINFPRVDFLLKLMILVFFSLGFIGILSRMYSFDLSHLWFSIRRIPMGISFLMVIGTLVYLLFSKNNLARIFASGMLLPFIAMIVRLVFVNISDNPGDNTNPRLFISSLITLTATSILAYRFLLMTKEKEKANEERILSNLEQLKQEQLAQQKSKEAARLEELDKVKSNFFSNITHEFRTPLTLIIEPLRQVVEQPEKPWLNKVKLAKNNSQKLLQLINQLLDISKLENNQMSLELKRQNIKDIIEPLIESFTVLAKEKKIQLNYQNHIKTPLFDIDQDKMEKIIINLISNAIKFTNEEGTINIKIKEVIENESPNFIFKIEDSGIGIPQKDQAHIFDRFYQVDGSNTRKYQGTGIGLSLCKELVELMNGKLSFESEEGKGSLFEVVIPMRFEMEEEKIVKVVEQKTLTVFENISNSKDELDLEDSNIALIVEDNDELRAFIKASIEDHYQIIEASNGAEGLEKAMEFIPNIIISDVMMPEMNGFELCEKIKTNEKTAHIPVILLTAKTAMDSRIQGLEFGADAYMNKPFNTKELVIRMKNLIHVRELLQEKYSQQIEGSTTGNPSADLRLSTYDEQFLENLKTFIIEHIGEEELNIENIAKEMAMSRTQLFRKTKALLNQSPSEFLRNIRLNKAKELLVEKKGNVSEIAYQVGFSSQKYFSTKFKEKYGLSPSEF